MTYAQMAKEYRMNNAILRLRVVVLKEVQKHLTQRMRAYRLGIRIHRLEDWIAEAEGIARQLDQYAEAEQRATQK